MFVKNEQDKTNFVYSTKLRSGTMSVRHNVHVYMSLLPYYIRHCLSVSGGGRSVVYWLKLTATVYLKYC